MPVSPPTLAHALVDRAFDSRDAIAFRTLVSGGAEVERSWSWREWCAASHRIAAGLRAQGVEPGDRVAIFAGNAPIWPLADQAVMRLGAVSVGLYPSSAPDQIAQVLVDSGARVLFVDSAERLGKVRQVSDRFDTSVLIVLDDGISTDPDPELSEVSLEFLQTGAEEVTLDDLPLPDPDQDAILIYTSGSTGVPKGARIRHRTLVASAESIRDTLGLRGSDRALSYLPFCHAAERITGQATRILLGMEAGLVPDASLVFEAAADFQPTFFGGLPRFYEKMWEAELAERGPDSPAPSPVIHRMTGGEVRIATSGGASLPGEVARGLDRLGLTVLGAYGLTEHLCCTFNRPGNARFDDVGTPMPGTELRIAADGEILIRRSELTFAGYHGRPEAEHQAFTEDGEWLMTGDLGELSDGVRLTVTGRKKELIALSTGKKVAPLPIETRLMEQPWIGQAVLVGEGRKYISALLTLRLSVVAVWARDQGLECTGSEWVHDPRIHAEVAKQVDAVNSTVSRTESVRRFSILETPFSVESGELTPTLKPRRSGIADQRTDEIERLYDPVAW